MQLKLSTLLPFIAAAACAGPQAEPAQPPSGGSGSAGFTLPNRVAGHLVTNRVPAVAVDAAGAIHVAYAANGVDPNGKRPAYYAVCTAACDRPESFHGVAIGDDLGDVQLALDGSGHPRLLVAAGPDADNIVDYQFWACDGSCADPSRWSGTRVLQAQGTFFPSHVDSQRGFAVDAHGRARFLYTNNGFGSNDPGGTGIAACDANCTQAASWKLAHLSDAEWKNPSLALDDAGRPRVLFVAKRPEPDYEPILNLLVCDTGDCSGAGTAAIPLLMTTTAGALSDPDFALRLDAAGHPRIALFPGAGDGGTLPPGRLYYLGCDGNCGDLASWKALDIGVEDSAGEGGLDLALDAAGRPRIAYRVPAPTDELSLASCDRDCMTVPARWHRTPLPSTRAVEAELGLPPRQGCPDCSPPIPPCPAGFWDAGYWPSIALDAQGGAHVAYEAQLQTGGGQCTAGTLGRISRLTAVEHP